MVLVRGAANGVVSVSNVFLYDLALAEKGGKGLGTRNSELGQQPAQGAGGTWQETYSNDQ